MGILTPHHVLEAQMSVVDRDVLLSKERHTFISVECTYSVMKQNYRQVHQQFDKCLEGLDQISPDTSDLTDICL